MNIAYEFFRKIVGIRIIKLTEEEKVHWEELKTQAIQKKIYNFHDVYVFKDKSFIYELKEKNGNMYIGISTKFIP